MSVSLILQRLLLCRPKLDSLLLLTLHTPSRKLLLSEVVLRFAQLRHRRVLRDLLLLGNLFDLLQLEKVPEEGLQLLSQKQTIEIFLDILGGVFDDGDGEDLVVLADQVAQEGKGIFVLLDFSLLVKDQGVNSPHDQLESLDVLFQRKDLHEVELDHLVEVAHLDPVVDDWVFDLRNPLSQKRVHLKGNVFEVVGCDLDLGHLTLGGKFREELFVLRIVVQNHGEVEGDRVVVVLGEFQQVLEEADQKRPLYGVAELVVGAEEGVEEDKDAARSLHHVAYFLLKAIPVERPSPLKPIVDFRE